MQPEVILSFFAKLIESELGIVYADHNYFQLQNRLEEIAKFLGVESVAKLYEMAQTGVSGQFKQLLLDVATNNETSFFRDPKIFKAIESIILPELRTKFANKAVAIWSAASSNGQEALSTAMLINEWNKNTNCDLNFSILGTDISERVLSRAKLAQYSQLEVQRGLPAPLLIKYFKKDEQDKWTASRTITKFTEFKKLNLKADFSFAQKFQIILCRNVLIYQSVQGKIEILKRITSALAPDGFLILGSGESLLGLSTDYTQTEIEGAVIYRRRSAMQLTA